MKFLTLLTLISCVFAQDPLNATYTKIMDAVVGQTPQYLSISTSTLTYCTEDKVFIINDPLDDTSHQFDIQEYDFPGGDNFTCFTDETSILRANDTHLLAYNLDSNGVVEIVTPSDIISMSELDIFESFFAICREDGIVDLAPVDSEMLTFEGDSDCKDVAVLTNGDGARTIALLTISDTLEIWDTANTEGISKKANFTLTVTNPTEIKSSHSGRIYVKSDDGIDIYEYNNGTWEESVNQGISSIESWSASKNDTSFMVFGDTPDPETELSIFEPGHQYLSPVHSNITSIQLISSFYRDKAYLVDQDGNLYRYGVALPPAPTMSPTPLPTTASPTTSMPTTSPTPPTPAPTSKDTKNTDLIIGLSVGGVLLVLFVLGLVWWYRLGGSSRRSSTGYEMTRIEF